MMKKFFLIFSSLLIAGALSGEPGTFNEYFIRASESVKPAVVNIIAYTKKTRDGRIKLLKISYGSGTIISGEGYIVTNYHVVKKGEYFRVICSDGSAYDVELFNDGSAYRADLKTDLAVMKIAPLNNKKFSPVEFADSNNLCEGEWVIAIGNPYGLKQSITAGIVSSKGRDNIGFTDIEDFIQTDVSINPGNSGGPLVNLYGEMVGINTAIRSASGGFQGISFAIPSNIVRQVCNDLIAYGRVRRGWLGIIAREKPASSSSDKKIVEVVSVIKGSPSYLAGIRQGDIVREVDGTEVESVGALTKIVGSRKIGSRIILLLSRNGKIINVKMVLREKEYYTAMQDELDIMFRSYGIEFDEDAETRNVVVTYVAPGSPYMDIVQGDIITGVNGERVSTIDDLVENYKEANREIKTLDVTRGSGIYEVRFDGDE